MYLPFPKNAMDVLVKRSPFASNNVLLKRCSIIQMYILQRLISNPVLVAAFVKTFVQSEQSCYLIGHQFPKLQRAGEGLEDKNRHEEM